MRNVCVIGWPVDHSLSPLIHTYWLQNHGLDGRYQRVAVAPVELEGFLCNLKANGWIGCNVTLPHKEMAAKCVHTDAVADRLGSVNTIWLENGSLHGTSTDGAGFVAHLSQTFPDWAWAGQTVVVYGAGGAARALAGAFVERGAGKIVIVNRTGARARAIARAFGPSVAAVGVDAVESHLSRAGLVVNATSLGMSGQPALALPVHLLRTTAIVADIVYTPLETPLLAAARARGLRTLDGLGMLLHQAVPGFEKWFGARPEVTGELRRVVYAGLEART